MFKEKDSCIVRKSDQVKGEKCRGPKITLVEVIKKDILFKEVSK